MKCWLKYLCHLCCFWNCWPTPSYYLHMKTVCSQGYRNAISFIMTDRQTNKTKRILLFIKVVCTVCSVPIIFHRSKSTWNTVPVIGALPGITLKICMWKNTTILFLIHPFFWSDEQTPEHALATCYGRPRLTYNGSITGELLSYCSCAGTGDDWKGRPRNLGQVSWIATFDGKWMVRQHLDLELLTLYVHVRW